jgi:hypothetical protein
MISAFLVLVERLQQGRRSSDHVANSHSRAYDSCSIVPDANEFAGQLVNSDFAACIGYDEATKRLVVRRVLWRWWKHLSEVRKQSRSFGIGHEPLELLASI